MFEIGEIKKGREIGKVCLYNNYIWHACISCRKERWVLLKNGKPRNSSCVHCAPQARVKRFAKGTIEHPEIGDIRSDKELGKIPFHFIKYIWAVCERCAKPRWVCLKNGNPRSALCSSCGRKRDGIKHSQGYIYIKINSSDFFFPMADCQGYVKRSRLVMAQHLGRCLQPWELVHHKDGVKDHDELHNLKLTTHGSHAIEHGKGYRDGYRHGFLDGQNIQIQELKRLNEEQSKQLKLLQWHITELEKAAVRQQ